MNTVNHTESKLAILSLIFAATMWGLIWYPMRLFEQAGMSVVWVTLIMYLTAGIASLPIFISQRFHWKQIPLDLLWLALAAGMTNLAFLVALNEGQVMRVMLLFYLSPLWSVILGRWWLGEKLSWIAIVMFVLAMGGTILMLWRPEAGLPWPHGLADWLALFASVCFAINNVLSRKLAAVPMVLKTTIILWGVVGVSIVVLFLQQASMPDVDITVWLSAVLVGGGIIIAMTVTVLYGLARMPVYLGAVIMLFELIVAAISSALLTTEMMTVAEWLGGALIFAAAFGIAQIEKNNR
ncbi:DMT family transporter [Methylophaga pinxianii]|uniref:DMT family transporter n=1 Tax=Methylophaga pinxianii TaxID=2881052 RepID=UPI001CF1018E|nr:DMT family transporter [Methylophaga pinxianii]MCB2428403.1 DMT family transporter [Methylophaga pinxianii]UPH45339.1 DMT family transporter [Methylophaga pinxianii]